MRRREVRQAVSSFLTFHLPLPFCGCLTLSEVRSLSLSFSDDQTWEWKRRASALRDGGSPHPPPHPSLPLPSPPTSLSPFWSGDKSRMKDLPFGRWWEAGDKWCGGASAGPSPGNREFSDSSDTAVPRGRKVAGCTRVRVCASACTAVVFASNPE